MNHAPNPFERSELKIMESGFAEVGSWWSQGVALFPYYRMYYVVRGHAMVYLQDKVLEFSPGNLYFIPAFSVVDANCDERLLHYWVHFNIDITTVNYLTICKPEYEVFAHPIDETVFRKLVAITQDPERELTLSESVASDGLIRYLFSRFLPDREDFSSSEAERFIPVLQYIDEHYHHRITNKELSEIMFLNSTYFSNLFTKQFGISPQQYILQKRMNAAALLLFETNRSIKEIAFTCGFENEIYFNRQFRKFMGMPPGKYRKTLHTLST